MPETRESLPTEEPVRNVFGEVTDSGIVLLNEMSQDQLSEWFDSENRHNGAHFMQPTDNLRYQELCKTDLREAIAFLRDKWSECADHDFIQSFALVHWVSTCDRGIDGLEEMLGSGRHEAEVSTQGYLSGKTLADNPRWLRAKFGVLLDGQVNLAGNGDIQTNQWHNLREDDVVKRRKYTEYANRLMTDDTNCVTPYEFVVDNWRAIGIISDPDILDMDSITAMAEKHGLPVIDAQNNDLFG